MHISSNRCFIANERFLLPSTIWFCTMSQLSKAKTPNYAFSSCALSTDRGTGRNSFPRPPQPESAKPFDEDRTSDRELYLYYDGEEEDEEAMGEEEKMNQL